MKRFYKIMLVLFAAVLVVTSSWVSVAAADDTPGYWKFSGKTSYIYARNVPADERKTGSFTDNENKQKSKWEVNFNDGTVSFTFEQSYPYDGGTNPKGSYGKITASISEPAAYYKEDEMVTLSGKVFATTQWYYNIGPFIGAAFHYGEFTSDNLGFTTNGNGFEVKDGSLETYSGEYNNNQPASSEGTIGQKFSALKTKYGDKANIVISCENMCAVYEYVWTKGTPSADAEEDYVTFTLKKGKSLQIGINTSSKVKYTSSNKSVATVKSSGKIKAKSKGTAIITMKYGDKTQKVKIIVN